MILERALDHINKPYRLFPSRFESIGEYSNAVDNSKEEVIILKLHGSLDWFSNKSFLRGVDAFKKQGASGSPRDPLFNNNDRYRPSSLVDGPRNDGDPLTYIHRLENIDEFYQHASRPTSCSNDFISLSYENCLCQSL